jgi:WD40 repeat protein
MTTGIGQHLPGSGGLEGLAGGAAGSSSSSSNPSWRPRGVLASHLLEHRAAVNCLATSNNGALLLSGSDDETVKVGTAIA